MTGIRLVGPSIVGLGEEFSIHVKMLCKPFFAKGNCYTPCPSVDGRFNLSSRGITYMDNVPPEWKGTIEIDGGGGYDGPASLSFADGTGPYPGDGRPIRTIENVRFATSGTKMITAQDATVGVKGTSNVITVAPETPSERLYWGDLHSQTFFSDGLRCPEELYAFAREEAFLDIFAMADHAECLTDRQWEYFIQVTNDYNQPNRFTTLIGLEWTSNPWGHRNIYYPGSYGPILRSTDPEHGELPKIFEVAREEGALVIPHHSANSAMGVDWSLGHDPEVERLVEIYSVWGNSEMPQDQGNPRPIRVLGGEKTGRHVLDALAMGRKFGFIGGGDIHDGRPGDELHRLQRDPNIYPALYRQGIMGVWSTALTRKAIFEALRNRSVFATTNVRVLLRFSIDGHQMGSEIRAAGNMEISLEAASDNPVARIDLVHCGENVKTYQPHERELRLELSESPRSRAGWYYVRLVREDGEMAWSSPIWYTMD